MAKTNNPRGRPPKDSTWKALLERVTTERLVYQGKKITKKEILARKLVQEALAGEGWAFKMIMDRMDGLPIQQIIQQGESHVHVTREIVGSQDNEGEYLEDPEV